MPPINGDNDDGLTDDDLLGGDDDGQTVDTGANDGAGDFSNANDGNDGPEGLLAGSNTQEVSDSDADDLEVVITDGSEVDGADGNDAGSDGADDRGDLSADDDGGEEVAADRLGHDFLTDWEKKNYSKAMQGRVQRERRLTATARDQAEQANSQIAALRMADVQNKVVIATLLAQSTDAEIASKTAALKAAKENANTDDEIKLQGELDDLRAKKREIDASKETLEKMVKDGVPAKAEDRPASAANPHLDRWLSRNKWIRDKRFSDEATYARVIDNTLGNEFKAGTFKFAPNTPQYFAEFDRRIKAKIPNLQTRVQKVYGQQQQQDKPRPRVAPVSRTAPASRAAGAGGSKTKVTLNGADLANMRNFGLDPKNPTHLKEYARNKITTGEING